MMRFARWAGLTTLLAAGAAGALDEVPFVTTPDRVTRAMLEIAGVGAGDYLIDLGSGDGRIVIAAARDFGARALGVEIDPTLVERSRANAQRADVADRVEFREQDLFKTDLSRASVITMYLLPDVNLALRPALLALKPGTRIVSHDWDMGDWLPDRTLTIAVPEKAIGREKASRVHLWIVPAPVAGLWCGPQRLALRLVQEFQRAEGRALVGAGDSAPVWGHLDGTNLHLSIGTARMRLAVSGDEARVVAADGNWSRWLGARLERTAGAHCRE